MSVSEREPDAVARALEQVHEDAERLKGKMEHGGRPGDESIDTSSELRKSLAAGEPVKVAPRSAREAAPAGAPDAGEQPAEVAATTEYSAAAPDPLAPATNIPGNVPQPPATAASLDTTGATSGEQARGDTTGSAAPLIPSGQDAARQQLGQLAAGQDLPELQQQAAEQGSRLVDLAAAATQSARHEVAAKASDMTSFAAGAKDEAGARAAAAKDAAAAKASDLASSAVHVKDDAAARAAAARDAAAAKASDLASSAVHVKDDAAARAQATAAAMQHGLGSAQDSAAASASRARDSASAALHSIQAAASDAAHKALQLGSGATKSTAGAAHSMGESVSQGASKAGKAAERTYELSAQQAAEVANEAVATVEAVRDVAADKLGSVRGGAARVAEDARGKVAAAGQGVAEKGSLALGAATGMLGSGNRETGSPEAGVYQKYEAPMPSDMGPSLSDRARSAVAGADQGIKEGAAELLHGGRDLLGRLKDTVASAASKLSHGILGGEHPPPAASDPASGAGISPGTTTAAATPGPQPAAGEREAPAETSAAGGLLTRLLGDFYPGDALEEALGREQAQEQATERAQERGAGRDAAQAAPAPHQATRIPFNPVSDPLLGSDLDNTAPNPLLGGPDLHMPGHVPPSMTQAGAAPLDDVQVPGHRAPAPDPEEPAGGAASPLGVAGDGQPVIPAPAEDPAAVDELLAQPPARAEQGPLSAGTKPQDPGLVDKVTKVAKQITRNAASSFKAEAMAPPTDPGTTTGGGSDQGGRSASPAVQGSGGFMEHGLTGGLGVSGYHEAPSRQQDSGSESMLARDVVGAVRGVAEKLVSPAPDQVAAGVSDRQVKDLTEAAGGYGVLGGTPRVDAVKEFIQDSRGLEPAGTGASDIAPGVDQAASSAEAEAVSAGSVEPDRLAADIETQATISGSAEESSAAPPSADIMASQHAAQQAGRQAEQQGGAQQAADVATRAAEGAGEQPSRPSPAAGAEAAGAGGKAEHGGGGGGVVQSVKDTFMGGLEGSTGQAYPQGETQGMAGSKMSDAEVSASDLGAEVASVGRALGNMAGDLAHMAADAVDLGGGGDAGGSEPTALDAAAGELRRDLAAAAEGQPGVSDVVGAADGVPLLVLPGSFLVPFWSLPGRKADHDPTPQLLQQEASTTAPSNGPPAAAARRDPPAPSSGGLLSSLLGRLGAGGQEGAEARHQAMDELRHGDAPAPRAVNQGETAAASDVAHTLDRVERLDDPVQARIYQAEVVKTAPRAGAVHADDVATQQREDAAERASAMVLGRDKDSTGAVLHDKPQQPTDPSHGGRDRHSAVGHMFSGFNAKAKDPTGREVKDAQQLLLTTDPSGRQHIQGYTGNTMRPAEDSRVSDRPVDLALAREKVAQVGGAILDSLTTSKDTPGTSKGRDSTGTPDALMTEARLAAQDAAEKARALPQVAGNTVTQVLESAAGAVEHVVEGGAQLASNLHRGLDLRSPEERMAAAEAETARLARLMEERGSASPDEMRDEQLKRMAAAGDPALKRETFMDKVLEPFTRGAKDEGPARDIAASYDQYVSERQAAGRPYDPVGKMVANAEFDTAKLPATTEKAATSKVDLAKGVRADQTEYIFSKPPTWAPDPGKARDLEADRRELRRQEAAGARQGPTPETRAMLGEGLTEQVGHMAERVKGLVERGKERAAGAGAATVQGAGEARDSVREGAQSAVDRISQAAGRSAGAAGEAGNSARQVAQTAADRAAEGTGKVAGGAAELRDSAAEDAQHAVDRTAEAAGRASGTAAEGAEAVSEAARGGAEGASQQAGRLMGGVAGAAAAVGAAAREDAEDLGREAGRAVGGIVEGVRGLLGGLVRSLEGGQQAGRDSAATAGQHGLASGAGATSGIDTFTEHVAATPEAGEASGSTAEAGEARRAPGVQEPAGAGEAPPPEEPHGLGERLSARLQAAMDDSAKAAGYVAGNTSAALDAVAGTVRSGPGMPPADMTTSTQELLEAQRSQHRVGEGEGEGKGGA